MATVDTTTIRVRRSTQQRLSLEARLAGKSVVDMLDAAADLLEEQRLLTGMDRAYLERGDQIRNETSIWDATLSDGLDQEG